MFEKVFGSNQKLEQEIEECLQNQLATEKGAVAWKKNSIKLRGEIQEKEATIAQTQNELSTIRLETLDRKARLESLQDQTQKVEADCEAKASLIEKYEQEMKKRHDELTKKASEVDQLNKKLQHLLNGEKNENAAGTLEATIRNMTNEIKAKEKECNELSHYWLKAQNELVAISKNIAETQEETQDLKMRLAVLERKRRVINGIF